VKRTDGNNRFGGKFLKNKKRFCGKIMKNS